MEIESKEASIQTVQVEIKILTVSDKQMTLAVFRQLPDSREFYHHETFEVLDGVTLWGWVNYHWKGCAGFRKDPPPHVHIVWEFNNKLYRFSFVIPLYEDPDYWTDEQRQKYNQLYMKLKKLPQLFIAV